MRLLTPKEIVSYTEQWILDLRTTKASQAIGFLEIKYLEGRVSNCCLGRLCYVTSEEIRMKKTFSHPSEISIYPGLSHQDMPKAFQVCEDLMKNAVDDGFIHRNDTLRQTFSQIADFAQELLDKYKEAHKAELQ